MLSNTATPVHYAKFRHSVLSGEVLVSETISLHMVAIDNIIADQRYYYDDSAIEGFIKFCENELTLPNGEDLTLLPSFKLWAEDLLAWFYFVEERVFNPDIGRYETVTVKKRLRNKQFLIVSRANAKSLYATAIQAYFLIVDSETTHQIAIAYTLKQANEITEPIATALARSRGPLFKFLTQGSIKSNTNKTLLASTKKGIQNFATNSILELRPMRKDKVQGLRSKVNTIDEWLSTDSKEDVIGAIEQGAMKINDYIIIACSSEGTTRHGMGDTLKLEIMAMLRGEYVNPHVSNWYYRLDDISEIPDPTTWIKANPNIGTTVSYSDIQKDVEKMEFNSTERNDIIAKRFGIPMEGLTYFFAYDATIPHLGSTDYSGMACSMGMDASQGDDFWAFTWLFPMADDYFGVVTRSYVSSYRVAKLPAATRLRYQEFINEGSLIVVDSPRLSAHDIFDDVEEYVESNGFEVLSFGYDPYNAAEYVHAYIINHSEYGVTRVIQGVRTESVPLGELRTLANARKLIFTQKLMQFSMENSICQEDTNGNRKLSKRRAEDKIDNVAAMMDAFVAYVRYQEGFVD